MPRQEDSVDYTVLARQALSDLWESAPLKGRCWGRKKRSNNPFAGTNITMATEDELVSVSYRNGKLVVHEFQRTENTSLGQKVKDALRNHNLPLIRGFLLQ